LQGGLSDPPLIKWFIFT